MSKSNDKSAATVKKTSPAADTASADAGPIGSIEARENTRRFTMPMNKAFPGLQVGSHRWLTKAEAEKLGLNWKD